MGVAGTDVAKEYGMMDIPSRPPEAPILTRELLIRIGIVGTLLLQLAYTYVAMMNRFFQSAPLDLYAWLRVFALGITAYIIVGFEKRIRRSKACGGIGWSNATTIIQAGTNMAVLWQISGIPELDMVKK